MYMPNSLLRKVDIPGLKRRVMPANITLSKRYTIEQLIDSIPLNIAKDLDVDILRLTLVYLLKIDFKHENQRIIKITTRDKVKQVLIFNYSRLLMGNYLNTDNKKHNNKCDPNEDSGLQDLE